MMIFGQRALTLANDFENTHSSPKKNETPAINNFAGLLVNLKSKKLYFLYKIKA